VVVGPTEYLLKGSADIFLFVAKVVHIYGEIQNLSILSYLLWFLFSVGGYFKHVVYYVIIEALVAPKRKIKKVYLSFSGDTIAKSRSMDVVLFIEAYAFCDLQYIKQVWYYSEILSSVRATFEQVDETYSSCTLEFQLVLGNRVRYGPSFLEKYIFLFQFSSMIPSLE